MDKIKLEKWTKQCWSDFENEAQIAQIELDRQHVLALAEYRRANDKSWKSLHSLLLQVAKVVPEPFRPQGYHEKSEQTGSGTKLSVGFSCYPPEGNSSTRRLPIPPKIEQP